MDGLSCAGAVIVGADHRGGVSVRRRAGNAGVQHQLRVVTTIDLAIRAKATADVAPAPATTVPAISALIAAVRRHPDATAHGAADDVRSYPLEDCKTKRPGAS